MVQHPEVRNSGALPPVCMKGQREKQVPEPREKEAYVALDGMQLVPEDTGVTIQPDSPPLSPFPVSAPDSADSRVTARSRGTTAGFHTGGCPGARGMLSGEVDGGSVAQPGILSKNLRTQLQHSGTFFQLNKFNFMKTYIVLQSRSSLLARGTQMIYGRTEAGNYLQLSSWFFF